MYEKLKSHIINNFEQVFVLVVLVAVLFTGLLVPYKLAMLHFFYLPVMLTGFVFGRKKALQGAALVILVVIAYVIFQSDQFTKEGTAIAEGVLSLVAWAGFLLLSGYAVGFLHDSSNAEKRRTMQLNVELKKMVEEGQKAFQDKQQSSKVLQESYKKIEELNLVIKGLREKMLENLVASMDPHVARMVFEKKLKEERREITVLSAALANFQDYAVQEQTTTVTQTIGRFLEDMEQIITDFYGHIEGYSGGSILCEFGAPVEYKTHAVLATVAALRMRERAKKLKLPWQLKVGIASGISLTALLGKDRKSYTALGPPINRAAHLRAASKPGRILIDSECYNKVKFCIEARLVRDGAGKAHESISRQLDDLEVRVAANPDDVGNLQRLAEIYLEKMQQPTKALKLLERALKLEPDSTEIKLAYAEANIQKESDPHASNAGPAGLVAYEVVGTRNPFTDENRIPRSFYERYGKVEELIGIPLDLILPIEALDGSVGHSRVVAVLSYAIAETLGLNKDQKKDILMAGYIQDIGKKLIPHHILGLTRRLTEKEFAHIRRHPTGAARVLASAGFNKRKILDIVTHHHERYNGKGYPFGKAGDDIPMGARITGVADTYDAMVAWRPYKHSMDRAAALAEIKKETRSGLFDPFVVDALFTVIGAR